MIRTTVQEIDKLERYETFSMDHSEEEKKVLVKQPLFVVLFLLPFSESLCLARHQPL